MIPYPEIDPVAVSLGPIQIHWYGLCYLGGIAAGWWLAIRRSAHPWTPVAREQVDDLVSRAEVAMEQLHSHEKRIDSLASQVGELTGLFNKQTPERYANDLQRLSGRVKNLEVVVCAESPSFGEIKNESEGGNLSVQCETGEFMWNPGQIAEFVRYGLRVEIRLAHHHRTIHFTDEEQVDRFMNDVSEWTLKGCQGPVHYHIPSVRVS